MTFLHPLFALAALAVIAPIALHLWKSRSSRDVAWGAWRFLSGARPDPRGRRRLTDIPLLLARCAVMLLVALAFAGFAINQPAPGLGNPSGAVVIAIDASGSMSVGRGNETLFARAKQRALEILDDLPNDSLVSVKSFPASPIETDSGWTTDKSVLRRVIQELEIRPEAVHLPFLLSQFGDAPSVHPGAGKRLIVVTDRAGALAIDEWRWSAPEDAIDLRVEVIQQGSFNNLAVTDLTRPMEPAFPGKKIRHTAVIRNFSDGGAPAGPVTILVNGRHYQSTEAGALPARGSDALEFDIQFTEAGWNYVTVRLGGDDLEGDNERSLAVYVHPEISILLLFNDDAGEVLYLRQALLASAENELGRVNVTTAPMRAFDPSSSDRPHVVMVNLPDETNEELLRQLMEYAADGGTALLFNGRAENGLGASISGVPLPARFGARWSAKAAGGTGFRQFQEAPYDHPVTKVWNRSGTGSLEARLESGVEILLAPSEASELGDGEARTILRYRDGSPAMVSCPVKSGRVILAGFDAAARGNDFPFRANFAPFLWRLAAHCVDGDIEGRTVTAGAWWRIESPTAEGGHVQLWAVNGARSFAGLIEVRDGESNVAIRSGNPGVFRAVKGEVDLGLLVAAWPEAESFEAAVDPEDGAGERQAEWYGDSTQFVTELSALLLLAAMGLLISESWIGRVRSAGRVPSSESGEASSPGADFVATVHQRER